MSIKEITLIDGTITITLSESTEVSKVWIDSLSNVANLYSEKDEEHTYSITQAGTSVDTI